MINDAIWQNYDRSGQIKQKLEIIKNWIPKDVESIIDVGCGNGIISNYLAQSYAVTGIDISETALKEVKTSKIQCSATDIPVPEKSFDLAFSSEMLEHLNDSDLSKAVSEMQRIAKKYILVSVPYQEQLAKSFLKCDSCGRVYHAYGHLHCFSVSMLRELFPQFEQVNHLLFGPLERDFHPFLLWIKNNLGKQYFHPIAPVICPQCKSTKYVLNSNLVSKLSNLLNRFVTKPKPYWLLMQLKRR